MTDDDNWFILQLLWYLTSYVCTFKKRYEIYDFSALVHLKFKKIEKDVISKKYFSLEMCWEHSVYPIKKVISHAIVCVSQVFSNI